MNADEEKVVGLDGTSHPTSCPSETRSTAQGLSSSWLSHDNRSLRTIRSHHSRAEADGHTSFDTEPSPITPNISNADGMVAEEPYLVTWDGNADPENPRTMKKLWRWIIVLICSASSLCVTCTSSLYASTYSQLESEFGASRLVCTLGLSLFVAGLGTGPMVLSPLSEFYGRRPIYICALAFFTIWMVPCAIAQNIQTMLIARFFDGLSGSAFLSVAGGTVGDMFSKHELSAPMMVYTASQFIGPELGPLIGRFIVETTTWRWKALVVIILVPETYHPVLLRKKAIRLRRETGNQEWIAPIEKLTTSVTRTVLWSCIRPFQLLIFEAMFLNLCLLSEMLLGILYLFFGAFPLVFRNNHGRIYGRLVRKREEQQGRNGGLEPEFRLPSTMIAAWVVPIALSGWTTYASYPEYAASALAANSLAWSYFAAVSIHHSPLFGIQMYDNLGY
ncbi:major facilitator superfamily domain-containing protein [Boeremia exigua]|uniref:major facilitator superfamily domain-containing protein n=1 Tax=Boeremia exigua TaxID=749465 RepID=UPI001E8DEE35|nr:major facilitator superfamily domain-containing protein [Boeremia exigua]KAH6615398.1 major facilitator superfamily domain-containing protein [Boeremia exigua]